MEASGLASFAEDGDGFEGGGAAGAVVVLGGDDRLRDADDVRRGEDIGLGVEARIRADGPALVGGDAVYAVLGRLVHEAGVIDELFHVAGRGHAAEELDVLHRLVRPGVAGGCGDVAERAEVRAGGCLSFHGHREPGNRLEERVFVTAVLAGPDRAVFVGHQRAHGADRADDRGENARDHFLLGENHRCVGEPAGGVAGRMDPVPGRNLADRAPEEFHVAGADAALGENDRRDVAVDQRVVVQLFSADGLDAEQFGPLGSGAFEKLDHPVEEISVAHFRRAHELAVVVRRHAEDGF